MEINYTLTEDDYIHFNLFHTTHSKTVKKSLLIQRLLGPIIFIAFSYLFSKLAHLPLMGLLITFSLVSILWIIFYPNYFYKLIAKNVKKAIREGDNDGLLGKRQMSFSDNGLTDYTHSGKTEISWQGVKEFKEDDDYFFLYNSAVSAYIIPKRELVHSDEVRAFLLEKLK